MKVRDLFVELQDQMFRNPDTYLVFRLRDESGGVRDLELVSTYVMRGVERPGMSLVLMERKDNEEVSVDRHGPRQ